MNTIVRPTLIVMHTFVAVTAMGGGVALVAGTVLPSWRSVVLPPVAYLEGSPFDSYIVPGLILLIAVAGTQTVALVVTARRRASAPVFSAAAGYVCLGWIFVQMIFIPFSFLQAAYFAAGCVELGLVMVQLGIFDRRGADAPATAAVSEERQRA